MLVVVERVDERGGVAEHLGSEPAVRRDDRDARGHRLERREPEALVARRVREHGRAGEQVAALRVGDVPEPDDPVAVRRGVDRGVEARPGPSRRDRRPRGGRPASVRRDRVERAHERRAGSCAARSSRARARSAAAREPGARRSASPPAHRRRAPRGSRRRASAATRELARGSPPADELAPGLDRRAPRAIARRMSAPVAQGVRACTARGTGRT